MIQSEDSIDNVFQTAAKMKEAQLKEKPERREWEAAPSFFKWTCGNYEHVLAVRDSADFATKLEGAQSYRQAGNDLFMEEQYEDALMKYSHAIAIFYWFQRRDGRYVDDVKLLNNLTEEPLENCEKAWEHLSSCFLNAASVLIKQSSYKDAVFCCSKALEFRTTAKGYFRRAQANYPQDTTYHLEQAVKDAQRAEELDPNDPKIKTSLTKWRSELAQQNTKDRKSFQNIFKHGELYTQTEIEAAKTKQSEIQSNTIDAPLPDGTGWMKPPFTEEAKKQALEAGIDLEDKKVQEHLLNVFEQKRKAERKAAASKGKDNYKHPETYLDFWKQLLTGNLRWRWHYIFYVALVANSCWQTSRILMAHARMGAESQPVVSDFDDFDSEL